MKRFIFAAAAAFLATAALAQQPAAPAPQATPAVPAASDPTKVAVAVINGEVITQAKLDALYANLNPQMRMQYDQNGGKGAFLDNYMRKRLLIQEALKSGFDQKPDVRLAMETARDGALFDRYVRDAVGAQFVTEADMRKIYDDHRADFATPEQRKLRHLVLLTSGAQGMAKADAAQRIQEIAQKLRDAVTSAGLKDPEAVTKLKLSLFKQAAQSYSQDGSAQQGGDLGWVSQQGLDPQFAAAAWSTPEGSISPVVESSFGYHLIYVEGVKPAGTQPFDEVKGAIREQLLSQHTTEIMNAVTQLTNQLRASGKVSVSPENIK